MKIQILIKTLNDINLSLEVDEKIKIEDIKNIIMEKIPDLNYKPSLAYKSKYLVDNLTLEDYSIKSGDMLNIIMFLYGG